MGCLLRRPSEQLLLRLQHLLRLQPQLLQIGWRIVWPLPIQCLMLHRLMEQERKVGRDKEVGRQTDREEEGQKEGREEEREEREERSGEEGREEERSGCRLVF